MFDTGIPGQVLEARARLEATGEFGGGVVGGREV